MQVNSPGALNSASLVAVIDLASWPSIASRQGLSAWGLNCRSKRKQRVKGSGQMRPVIIGHWIDGLRAS